MSSRGTSQAKAWLERSSTEVFGIPGVVAMELLIGCRNRAEIEKLQKFLSAFSIVWPDAAEFAQAYELLAEHRLTSGLGIPDCLMAAMSLIRKARLYTFNLKHFQVIPGIDVQEPYSRQELPPSVQMMPRTNLLSLDAEMSQACALFSRFVCRETVAEPYLLTPLGMQSERKQIPQVVENIESRRQAMEPLEGQGVRPKQVIYPIELRERRRRYEGPSAAGQRGIRLP